MLHNIPIRARADPYPMGIYPGYIYIVKGSTDRLWLFLKEIPLEVKLLTFNSESEFKTICGTCRIHEKGYSLVIQWNPSLPLNQHFRMHPRNVLFVSLSSRMTKSEEKLFKNVGGQYKALDLRAYPNEQDCPLKSLWLQQQSNPDLYESPSEIEDSIISNLDALAEKDYHAVERLCRLPKYILHRYFLIPEGDIESLGLRGVLMSTKGLYCPELYLHYCKLYIARADEFVSCPHWLVKLFFLWVYQASTIYAEKYKGGLETYEGKFGKGYSFNPSDKALRALNKLILGDF